MEENEQTPEEEQEQIIEAEETEETPEVDYKALYEEERYKATKLKRKLLSKESAPTESPKSDITNRSDEKWKVRMELKVDGYNDEEADFIMKNGGQKALANPYISSAIESMREKKKAENAMIDSNSPKSETEKRFTPEAFAKLPSSEQFKILSEQ